MLGAVLNLYLHVWFPVWHHFTVHILTLNPKSPFVDFILPWNVTMNPNVYISFEVTVWVIEYFLWRCSHVHTTRPKWWLVNIGSFNGLLSSDSKSLPEPMSTHVCCHVALQSRIELMRSPLIEHMGKNLRIDVYHLYSYSNNITFRKPTFLHLCLRHGSNTL